MALKLEVEDATVEFLSTSSFVVLIATLLAGAFFCEALVKRVTLIGRHLVGVWIGGVWNDHFPEPEKYFSEAEISWKIPEIPQKERFSPNFRL